MEMDGNLKRLANFLQVPRVYFGEIAAKKKKDYIFFLPRRNHFIFSSRFSKRKGFFVNEYLSSFGKYTAESP